MISWRDLVSSAFARGGSPQLADILGHIGPLAWILAQHKLCRK
jgi:hypothetical protein